MKMVGFVQGWKKAMLHKNVEIRANWESVANEGKEILRVRGWSRLYDGGRIGRDVLQVFCTLFSKTDPNKD
jgi:hypothetical protein